MGVHRVRYVALMIGLCLLLSLACQLGADLETGGEEAQTVENPTEDTGAGDGDVAEISDEMFAEALAYVPVDERHDVLALLGRPDAFKMSVLNVDGALLRHESWWYFGLGTQVDFVDGETVWTLEVEPAPAGSIFPAWYDPLTFQPGMSAVAAMQLATNASPAGTTPEIIDVSEGGEELVGGLILVGDQIMIGVQDDEVVYVETVPLFPEEASP